jgi:hypothetical protein
MSISLDLAKAVFKVHAVDATGQAVVRKMLPFFYEVAALSSWHRSVRDGTLLGT